MLKILIAIIFLAATGCVSTNTSRILATEPSYGAKLLLTGSLKPTRMRFISHTGPGPFDNALALSIPYEPIKELRVSIEKVVKRPLDYFKGWDPKGEAHVTTITPPEYSNVLSTHLSMNEIEAIAAANKIQNADLLILGVGSGKKEINGTSEETFFVIVDSQKLRQIRNEIWTLFVKKGGDPKSWDPTWFFPHITVGYTKQDLHEPDVVKNLRSSSDDRFQLMLQ